MNEYMNEYMKETNEALLHTYNQFPVVLDHGEGAYLYDTEGKKYLDFSAGYAVSSLGYNNKEFNDALYAAGLQKIMDEKQKQLDEWAASK